MTANPSPSSAETTFPKNFLWGAATCPACSEGETVSDWAKLSAPDGSVPDDGPRHWRRYRFDFRAMANIGIKAYRFGCDWARLQRGPYEPFVRDDLYRYLEMLAELRSLGIEPWLVLFHNALPRWATSAGGWLNRETPHWFADYVRRLAEATDGEAMHWITIHEPQVYAFGCHAWDWYPGGSWGRLDKVRGVLGNLLRAHELASRELRRRLPGCRVGVSMPGGWFFPRRVWHPGDLLASSVAEWCLNRYGLRRFLRAGDGCDFMMLGVGNEIALDARVGLSLSSVVAPGVAERLRESDAPKRDVVARRRRLRTRAKECGVPVYAMGGAGKDARDLDVLLSGCAGGETGLSGFFYDPLVDQFDLQLGLSARRGLLRVDFHGADRRREMRDAARVLIGTIKTSKNGTS